MKRTLLLILTLSGLSALSTKTSREYHYVQMLKTWAEAQRYCREAFTDLATVENEDENDRLVNVLRGRGKYAWIGLYDDLTRWKWSLGNADFNNQTDFSNWDVGEPVTKHLTHSCTKMTKKGLWGASLCWRSRPAVCYDGSSRYVLVNTEMSWYDAQTHCQSKYTDLASVRNMDLNNHISKKLSAYSWIGLHRNSWVHWSDQSQSNFTKWDIGQPDDSGKTEGSCAAVNTTTGRWWDVDCKTKHHFICQKVQLQRKATFKLKFRSEADLNNPAAQQQILEQLHAKLEKDGLPDFKLRWLERDGQAFHKEQQWEKEGSDG